MELQVNINVNRVGSGEIIDEDSGNVTEWAKIYSNEQSFVDNDMFTGIMDVEYSLIDRATGEPSPALAQKIRKLMRVKKLGEPFEIVATLATKSVKKKSTLVIVDAEAA